MDQIRQDRPWSHGRQLVNVADQNDGGVVGHGLEERVRQRQIHHADFIREYEITLQRIFGIPFEGVVRRIVLQQPMDGLRLAAGRLGHPLRCPSCRGAQDAAEPFGGEYLEDAVDDGRFADAGPARDDHDFRCGGQRHRSELRLGELEPDLLLDPDQGFLDVDRGERMPACGDSSDATGELGFRVIQGGQVDADLLVDPVPDQSPMADLVVDGGADDRFVDLQQLDRFLDQAVFGEGAMPFGRQCLQDVPDARPRSLR